MIKLIVDKKALMEEVRNSHVREFYAKIADTLSLAFTELNGITKYDSLFAMLNNVASVLNNAEVGYITYDVMHESVDLLSTNDVFWSSDGGTGLYIYPVENEVNTYQLFVEV